MRKLLIITAAPADHSFPSVLAGKLHRDLLARHLITDGKPLTREQAGEMFDRDWLDEDVKTLLAENPNFSVAFIALTLDDSENPDERILLCKVESVVKGATNVFKTHSKTEAEVSLTEVIDG